MKTSRKGSIIFIFNTFTLSSKVSPEPVDVLFAEDTMTAIYPGQ